MPYSNNNDLINSIGSDELARITGGSSINTEMTDLARENADAIIDGYLFGRVGLDIDNIPELILKLSVDLTIVNLSENYYRLGDVPNTIIRKKRDSITILKDIASGKIIIGSDTTSESIISITNIGK